MEEEELPLLYPHSCITSLLLSAAAAAAHGSFFLPLLLLLLVLVLVLALFIVEMGGTNIPISVPNPSINGRQLAMIQPISNPPFQPLFKPCLHLIKARIVGVRLHTQQL